MNSNTRAVALVTGASSGIGAALARELAADGHDLILVARRVDRMRALAEALKTTGAASTVIAADLSKAGAAEDLVRDIAARGLTVEVLVANAGLGVGGRFDASDLTRIETMLQVNVVALTQLTRLLLPDMLARRRGKVMLVASTAAFQPCPGLAAYAATKAYVLSFGQALAFELRGSGVTVSTLCPGATATEFAAVAKLQGAALFKASRLTMMDAQAVARIGYQGLKAGRAVVITGRLNKVMKMVGRFVPNAVKFHLFSRMISTPD
jgi:short-subunit dehydrogenase